MTTPINDNEHRGQVSRRALLRRLGGVAAAGAGAAAAQTVLSAGPAAATHGGASNDLVVGGSEAVNDAGPQPTWLTSAAPNTGATLMVINTNASGQAIFARGNEIGVIAGDENYTSTNTFGGAGLVAFGNTGIIARGLRAPLRLGQSVAANTFEGQHIEGEIIYFSNSGLYLCVERSGNNPDVQKARFAQVGYNPVRPTRVVDTRPGAPHIGVFATLGPGQEITVRITGSIGIDEDNLVPYAASAATLNVTATSVTEPGFLTLWPSGSRPTASNVNFKPGFDTANLAMVKLADITGGHKGFKVYNGTTGAGGGGTTDVILDLAGFFV